MTTSNPSIDMHEGSDISGIGEPAVRSDISAFVLCAVLLTSCAAAQTAEPQPDNPKEVTAVAHEEGVAAFRARKYSEALEDFRVAGTGGDGDALFLQAMMYDNGCGVSKNHETADRLLEQAAANNSAAAKFWLAGSMAFGDPAIVNKSKERFMQLMREAAEGGFPPAMDMMPDTFRKGPFREVSTPDPVNALAWQSLALKRWQKALGAGVNKAWWSRQQLALSREEAKLSSAQLREAGELEADLDRRIREVRSDTVELIFLFKAAGCAP